MEKLTEAQLHEMADLISETIVVRDTDKDGNTRDYSRPSSVQEAQIINNIAASALWAENWNIDSDCNEQRQALKDMAEVLLGKYLPYCNCYSTIYVPLDNAFRQWEKFAELNPSINKSQLDDRHLFSDAQLEEWAEQASKNITIKENNEFVTRNATAEEAQIIKDTVLLASKEMNACDNLEELLQVEKAVFQNAIGKLERLLPYCSGMRTVNVPLDNIAGYFERGLPDKPNKNKAVVERE